MIFPPKGVAERLDFSPGCNNFRACGFYDSRKRQGQIEKFHQEICKTSAAFPNRLLSQPVYL